VQPCAVRANKPITARQRHIEESPPSKSLWLDLPIIIAELGVPDSGRGSTARPQSFGHEARNRYAFAPWRASRVQWRSPHRQRPACCFQLREALLSRDWSLSACRVRNQSRVAREPDAHKRDGTTLRSIMKVESGGSAMGVRARARRGRSRSMSSASVASM
jgi:hypothetical protein